jgi:hypothetical protein
MTHKHLLARASILFLALSAAWAQDRVQTGLWQTAPAKPAAAAPAKSDDSRSFTGKVLETMDAATYTYVQVEVGTEKLWAAAPKTEVKVGDTATVTDGMLMSNYHSPTLNRDFPKIYFAGSLRPPGEGSAALPKGHPPLGGSAAAGLPAGHPPMGGAAAKPSLDLTGIVKAKGGQTIQEVYTDKKKLAGKEVVVRGKVVKYNSQIMGKNWLHIRDGSGTEGSNDLTVTTSTPAKVGDLVLVAGVLSADKDFGAGYKFAVILDDAKVVVE